MAAAFLLVRALPLGFVGRCAIAFVEIALAAAILAGSVAIGHDLAEWRAWYGAPTTIRHWAPTPQPSPVAEPPAR